MKSSHDIIADTIREISQTLDDNPLIAHLLEPEVRERIDTALAEAEYNASALPSLWGFCATMPEVSALDLGYDPARSILSGQKTHSVRRRRVASGRLREITLDAKRSGIVLRFGENWQVDPATYTRDDFALGDGVEGSPGVSPGHAMRLLFAKFYGDDTELTPMTCNSFTLEAVEARVLRDRGLFVGDLPDGVRVIGV